ncbi:hypothetical protein TNCV_3166351 [Trichonephila clavipes]|uniref:Uncharacterized protein n=1 Tax=Trichonephila clavipes TaxID=2585209 RepID=A0A8X6REL9_TRICX|nr:hypothetical protein TNCV_3166351 [Trichonephila clavipes]
MVTLITLNSHRAASPTREVGGRAKVVRGLCLSQGDLPQNWGLTELNRIVACTVLNVRLMTDVHLAPCHEEFCGPGSDLVEIRWHKKQQQHYLKVTNAKINSSFDNWYGLQLLVLQLWSQNTLLLHSIHCVIVLVGDGNYDSKLGLKYTGSLRSTVLNVDSDDVQELLNSHDQEQTIDELIEMHEQEQDIEELESLDIFQTEDRMMFESLTKGHKLIEKGLQSSENKDFTDEHIFSIKQGIKQLLACNEETVGEKKSQNKQNTLLDFI